MSAWRFGFFLDPLLGQVLTRGSPGHASLTRTLLSQSTHIRYIWAQAPLLPETNRKGAAIATCICIYWFKLVIV